MYMTEAEMTATLNGSKTFTGIDFNAVVVTRAGDKNELIAYNTTGAGKALVDLETEIKNSIIKSDQRNKWKIGSFWNKKKSKKFRGRNK